MTTPLPVGLLSIVATTEIEPSPSNPAELRYLRACLLNSFWKRHSLFRKVYKDDVNYRCEQFFWRIWNNPTLSQLSDAKLKELWFRLQTPTDLAAVTGSCPLTIRGGGGSDNGDDDSTTQTKPAASETGRRSSSVSPTNIDDLPQDTNASSSPGADVSTEASSIHIQRASGATSRPMLTRNTSGKGKRTTFAAGTKTAKNRPTPPRKRSSQSNAMLASNLDIRPILRSPQTSSLDPSQKFAIDLDRGATPHTKSTATPSAPPNSVVPNAPARRVPGFELGSPDEASSWQSTDSNIVPDNARPGSAKMALPLQIEPNFRQVFQKQKSSSALAAMTGGLRKTGSIVRFAEDAQESSEYKAAKTVGAPSRLRSSEGALPTAPGSWRDNSSLEHRDSTGSVAAISDDSDEEDRGGLQIGLPRVKSGLSLAMDALKHTRASCESEQPDRPFAIVTSPQIEAEQEALISGKKGRKQTDEEVKLLEMGHKDGVTKAGGVNFPRNLRVAGDGKEAASSELPEMRIF